MPGSSSALSGAAALSPTPADEPARQAALARLAAALREFKSSLNSPQEAEEAFLVGLGHRHGVAAG